MSKNKNLLKALIAVGAIAFIAIIMLVVYNQFKPEVTKGSKEIVVEVVIPDEDSQEVTIRTDAEFLRQALDEKKLVKGSEGDYGLYITEVNGRVADESKQEWWCITKDGEDVFTGIDFTPIADGEHYEITLTVGY